MRYAGVLLLSAAQHFVSGALTPSPWLWIEHEKFVLGTYSSIMHSMRTVADNSPTLDAKSLLSATLINGRCPKLLWSWLRAVDGTSWSAYDESRTHEVQKINLNVTEMFVEGATKGLDARDDEALEALHRRLLNEIELFDQGLLFVVGGGNENSPIYANLRSFSLAMHLAIRDMFWRWLLVPQSSAYAQALEVNSCDLYSSRKPQTYGPRADHSQ